VSIIVPTAGNFHLLQPFVESLRTRTKYRNFELVVLDNSRGRHPASIEYLRSLDLMILERNEPYNWSKLNNDGVRASDGDLLLFMNDDIEIVEEEWLGELASLAVRPGVGTVGPLLLYPDGTIQHAGVILRDHGGGASHMLLGARPGQNIYLNLDQVVREVTANTGACLMVSRATFTEVGGFDEQLPVALNDIDFCLKLASRGLRNLWTPHALLTHHENVSRTHLPVSQDEHAFWRRWGPVLEAGDPYYSPNLVPDRSDGSINHPERLFRAGTLRGIRLFRRTEPRVNERGARWRADGVRRPGD
jgi:GT2 family glycosyltransferase